MKQCLTLICLILSFSSFSFENAGRFGIGTTSFVYGDGPAVSLKIHFNEKMAIGSFFSYQSGDNSQHTFGGRFYNSIISEPNLLFYTVASLALVKTYVNNTEQSGYQADINVGSEFFFEEIKHIGLSFEAGIGITNFDEMIINTTAAHIFKSAVHFYF